MVKRIRWAPPLPARWRTPVIARCLEHRQPPAAHSFPVVEHIHYGCISPFWTQPRDFSSRGGDPTRLVARRGVLIDHLPVAR